jgi:hypothetical protein
MHTFGIERNPRISVFADEMHPNRIEPVFSDDQILSHDGFAGIERWRSEVWARVAGCLPDKDSGVADDIDPKAAVPRNS